VPQAWQMQSKGVFLQQLLMQGLAASGGRASVLKNAAATAACGALAVTASESVHFTVPLGQAATARATEPAAEAGEGATKSSASVGAAQQSVASAAGAAAVQEAVGSPAGWAHAASGAGPFRQTADSVIEASMSSAAERAASGGNSLHPPQPHAGAAINSVAEAPSQADQQQALVQAFAQCAMVVGTSLPSTAPESVTAAVLSVWTTALNTNDLQRGSVASEHDLAANEACVAFAKSTACPAADLKGTAGSAAASATAATAAPAAATPSSALEAGSTAALLTCADETAAASTVDAAMTVSKPSADETAAVSTVDAAVDVSEPSADETAAASTVDTADVSMPSADKTAAASTADAALDVSKPSADETAAQPTADAAVDVSKPSAADAAMLDALHYGGAGPAKLQLMGQNDLPRLVGSGAFSTWHGYVLIDFCTLCMI